MAECGKDPSDVEWFADKGNGKGGPLSDDQKRKLASLYGKITHFQEKLKEVGSTYVLDYELCRRFLVARQWSEKKALAQITKMVEWRIKYTPNFTKLEDSPVAQGNPYAVNLRCCGYDSIGRPVMYTCFGQANDRFHPEKVTRHLRACMEECYDMLRQRRLDGLNTSAEQLQWVWMIDFGGFSVRDQSPKSAMLTMSLMQNYPELLGILTLVNAPWLFSGLWRALQRVVDDRTKAKIQFMSTKKLKQTLEPRIGKEMSDWLHDEVVDNIEASKTKRKKAYWLAPDPAITTHDPRGPESYRASTYYIRTPGDKELELNAKA